MEEKKKRHHYVSQLLLRKFSPSNHNGRIYVLERPDKENLRSIAKHTAFEYDYNVLEIEESKNDDFEKHNAELEMHIGKIYEKILSNNFELTDNEWSYLLYFATILFVNSPNYRDKIERINLQLIESIAEKLTNDKNLFTKIAMETDYVKNNPSEDLEKHFQRLKLTKGQNLKVSQNHKIFSLLKHIKPIFSLLAKMYWSFNILKDESVYITSDVPIIPLNSDQTVNFNLGFEYSKLAIFPLTKKICLVGNWKIQCKNEELFGDYANAVNGLIMKWAFKQLYSPLNWEHLQFQFEKYK